LKPISAHRQVARVTIGDRPAGEAIGADVRTFLIADVRGYTRFTHEHGDEGAAALAARFADLARRGIERHGGTLLELRGDEALGVFISAREAIRLAVELQRLFRAGEEGESGLPLGVGFGVDAGEAVPVEGRRSRTSSSSAGSLRATLWSTGRCRSSPQAPVLGRRGASGRPESNGWGLGRTRVHSRPEVDRRVGSPRSALHPFAIRSTGLESGV
jgi:hypothetical protein